MPKYGYLTLKFGPEADGDENQTIFPESILTP
jgi:hypothetical protein